MLNTAVHILTTRPYNEQMKIQILCKCNIIHIPYTEDDILHTTPTKRTYVVEISREWWLRWSQPPVFTTNGSSGAD